MQVVRDPTAQAGQDPNQPAEAQPAAEQKKTGGLFWFVAGVVGGAVLMHVTARKMQEYAGGMYSARAKFNQRLGMGSPYGGGMGGNQMVSLEDEDDEGFFG